jgi:transcriptional regulator with XRE-family HTH domain
MTTSDAPGQTKPRPRLRAARRRRGWSQVRAAIEINHLGLRLGYPEDQLRVDAHALSRWERGVHEPKARYIRIMCGLYELPADQLDLAPPASADTGGVVRVAAQPDTQTEGTPHTHSGPISVRIGSLDGDVVTFVVNRREFLEAVGGAVVTAATIRSTQTGVPPEHPAVPEVTRLLFGQVGSSGSPVTLADLDARVSNAWQIWTTDPQRYSAIRPLLPQLTGDVERAVRQFSTPQEQQQRRRAYEIAAHHYFLLRSFFRAVARYDLATMTADRGLFAADAADDPILIAGAKWNIATVLLIDDRASLGHEIAVQAADTVASVRVGDSRAAAMYGALHLTAATAAARSGQLAAARGHIWQHAEPTARMTGEANHLWTQFGPLNVGVIAVGVETALGNTTDALRVADRVDAAKLSSVERRATYLLEVAQSYELRGEDTGVLHYVARAERAAPEDVRYQPLAASLVRGLLVRSRPTLRPDIESLAARVGIER